MADAEGLSSNKQKSNTLLDQKIAQVTAKRTQKKIAIEGQNQYEFDRDTLDPALFLNKYGKDAINDLLSHNIQKANNAAPQGDRSFGEVAGDMFTGAIGTTVNIPVQTAAMASNIGVGAFNLRSDIINRSVNMAVDPNFKAKPSQDYKNPYATSFGDPAGEARFKREQEAYTAYEQSPNKVLDIKKVVDVQGNFLSHDIGGAIEDAQNYFYSDKYKAQEKARSQKLTEYESDLKQARIDAGEDDDASAISRDQTKVMWKAIKSIGGNPVLLVQKFVENAPYIFSASAVSKGVAKKVLATELKSVTALAKKEAIGSVAQGATASRLKDLLAKSKNTSTKELQTKVAALESEKAAEVVTATKAGVASKSEQTTERVSEATEKAALVTTAVLEGSGNASDYTKQVLDTPFADLRKTSDKFNKYEKQYGEVKARELVAQEGALEVGIESGVAAALVSKVTYGAKFEANLFKELPKESLRKTTKNIVGVTAKEFTEEASQSGSGTLITNIVKKKDIDPNQDITEGVGRSTGEGAIVGAFSAGGMQTIKSSGTILKRSGKHSITGSNVVLTGAKKQAAQVVQKVQSIRTDTETRETGAELDASLTKAEEALANPDLEQEAKLDELAKATAFRNAVIFTQDSKRKEIAQLNIELEDTDLTKDQIKSIKGDIKLRNRQIDHLQGKLDDSEVQSNALKDTSKEQIGSVDDAIKSLSSKDTSKVQQAVAQIEHAISIDPSSISMEQAKATLKADINNQLGSIVQLVLNNVSEDRLSQRKDTVVAVAKDKVEGSKGFTGLNQYRDALYQSLLSDNPVAVKQIMDTLGKWVTSDNARTSIILSAMDGDPAALATAKTRYKIERINPTNALITQNENKLMHDVYNNLHALVLSASSDLAEDLTFASFDKLTQAPKQAPKESFTKEAKTTPVKDQVFTKYSRGLKKRSEQLPKGFSSISAYLKSGNYLFATSDGSERTFPKRSIRAVENYFNKDWNQEQLNTLESQNKITADKIKYVWNALVSPDTDPAMFQKAVKALNQMDTIITKLGKGVKTKSKSKVEPKVTKQVDTAPVSSPKESSTESEATIPEVTQAGTIEDSLVQKTPVVKADEMFEVEGDQVARTKNLESKNIVQEYFKIGSALNKVRDFFGQVAENDYQLIKDNLPEKFFTKTTIDGVTKTIWGQPQIAAVNKFNQFKAIFDKNKADVEKDLKGRVAYRNYAVDLLNEQGELDSNIYDALTLGIYKWLNTEAGGTLFTDERTIERKLGVNNIPYEARVLHEAGVNQDEIIDSIGSLVYGTLGFTVNKNVDKSAKAKMINSLGQVAMQMAMDEGIIYQNENIKLDIATYEAWKGNKYEGKGYQLEFFKVSNSPVKNELPKVTSALQEYIDVETASGKVMTSLFDKDNLSKQPLFSKQSVLKFLPKVMKGTNQLLPKALTDIISKHMQRTYQIKQGMHDIHSTMSRTQKAEMLGYLSQEDINKLPYYKRQEAITNNETAIRSIQTYTDFVESLNTRGFGLKAFIYYPHEVWRNLRMGMVSNSVNPQSSKYDRHLIGLTEDETTIKLGSVNRQHVDFLSAVALGFGVSTDKLTEGTAMDQLHSILQNEVVIEGIKSARKLRLDDSQAETLNNNIIAAVKVLGESMHSYEALIAYADYLTAIDKGSKTFTTNLTAESDGITNGPALGLFLMGGASANIEDLKGSLVAAGFKFKGDLTSHGEWKETAGNKDLYERSSAVINNMMQASTLSADYKQALSYFIGADNVKAMRDFAKEPTTGSSYGQGEMSVKNYAGSYALGKIQDVLYKGGKEGWNQNKGLLQDILNGFGSSVEESPLFTKAKVEKAQKLFNEMSYDSFFKEGLPKEVTPYLMEAYKTTYGEMLNSAIAENFAGLKTASKLVGGMSNVMYVVYTSKLNEAIENKKQELQEASPEDFNTTIDDLPKDDYAEVVESVREFLPVFDNVFSRESSDLLNNGIRIGKSLKAKSKDNSHAVDGIRGKIQVTETVEANPGISAMAALIHSIDASIMYRTLSDNAVTNIFDAILSGIKGISKGTRALNKAAYDTLKELNPLENVYNRFNTLSDVMTQEMYENLSELDKEALARGIAGIHTEAGLEVKVKTITSLLKSDAAGTIAGLKPLMQPIVQASVDTKNQLLKDLTYVTQYNKEGDGAVINEDGSVSFNEDLDTKGLNIAADQLIKDMGNIDYWVVEDSKVEPVTEPKIKSITEFERSKYVPIFKILSKQNPVENAALTQLGKDITAGNALDFTGLSNQTVTTFKQNMRTLSPTGTPVAMYPESVKTTQSEQAIQSKLVKAVKAGQGKIVGADNITKAIAVPKRDKTYNLLMKFIMPLVPADTAIQLITGSNYADIVTEFGEQIASGSKGFFNPNTNTIYLRTSGDVFNGMSYETITHELVHAVLANIESSTDPKVILLQDRLNDLLVEIHQLDGSDQYAPALVDTGELLAWGLTNTAFQSWLKSKKQKTPIFTKFKNALMSFFGLKAENKSVFAEVLEASHTYFELGAILPDVNMGGTIQAQTADPINRNTEVDHLNAVEVFDSLESRNHVQINTEHQKHLRELMSTMFSKAMQPIQLAQEMNNVADMSETIAERVVLSTFDTGASVPSVGMIDNGFNASTQEVYANGVLNAILHSVSGDSSFVGKRINDLFKLARGTVKPEDLRILGSESKEDLQTKWNSIFEAREDSAGEIHHLREFLAMAQTNEVLRIALNKINVPANFARTEGKTFLDKVQNLVGHLLDMAFSKFKHVPIGGTALSQLDVVAKNIALQEDKAKNIILIASEIPLNGATILADRALKLTRTGLKLVAGNNRANPVSKVAKLLGDSYDNKGANLGKAATIFGNKIIGKGRLGFNSMLMNETMGENDTKTSRTNSFNNTKIHSLLRQFKTLIDKVGQENKSVMIQELRRAFGRSLTVKEASALTGVVLRADLPVLLKRGIALVDVVTLLQSTNHLQDHIDSYKKQLRNLVSNTETYNAYVNGSRAMGIAMIKDINTEALTSLNPQRIMDMDGFEEFTKIAPVKSDEVLSLIDALGSLYALRTTEPSERSIAAKVMGEQLHKTENGIKYLVSMSTAIQEEAKLNQFSDAPKNFVKGFVPDATDSTKAMAISELARDPELLRQGYKRKKLLHNDPKDFTGKRYLYVNSNGGAASYNQGAAYINEKSSQGHSIYKDRMRSPSGLVAVQAQQDFADIKARKQADILSMLKSVSSAKKGANYMRPSFDNTGTISDFRYITAGATKDTYLNRNNDAFLAMGNMANLNHVVPKTDQANKKVVDALKMQYDEDKKAGNLSRYILLNNRSSDRALRKAYGILPKDMRDYATEVFGKNGLPIRNDLYDVVIGQRKWGISDIWKQEEGDPKIKYLVAKAIDVMTVNTGKYWLPTVERGVMEAVSKVKDIVVNLSGTVLMANTVSNTNYLVSRGLTTSNAIKLQAEAMDAVKEYNKLNERKITLEMRIKGGYKPTEHARYYSELKRISGSMQHNKVTPMIDAGLLSTVAEELEVSSDSTHSYGARLSNWIDTGLGKNSTSRATLHNLAFTKETQMYKAMSNLTQLSDFTSKYALVNYLTTRTENQLTEEQAYAEATRAFVNYDLPTHQALRYLGDLGLLWFPRYAVRIQRTILDSIADNPARVLALVSINLMTGSMLPTIYQSLMGVAYNPMNLVGFLDRFASGAMLHPTLRLF